MFDQNSGSTVPDKIHTWNAVPEDALPEDVTSSQSEYTFCRHLKTWLFQEVFSGHHHLILRAS